MSIREDNIPVIFRGQQGSVYQNVIGRIRNHSSSDADSRAIKVIMDNAKISFQQGYMAYLFSTPNIPTSIADYLNANKIPFIISSNYLDTLQSDDVVELQPDNRIRVIYRKGSNEYVIKVTNQCNCNCIMCPDSVHLRRKEAPFSLDYLVQKIELIEPGIGHITVTGGEPTLLKELFLEIMAQCRLKLPKTDLTILTNGRMFFYQNFAASFIKASPKKTVLSIPMHGHTPELHDSISRSGKSFLQTFKGISHVLELGGQIELRIVINRLNYKYLENISAMIIHNFPSVTKVIFMTLEMLGNAFRNDDIVWIDYSNIGPYLKRAAVYLLKHSMAVSLYNFPLCYLDKDLWGLAAKSISGHKARYDESCRSCTLIDECGGFFASTLSFKKLHGRPLLEPRSF